jgi:hypothetical protein
MTAAELYDHLQEMFGIGDWNETSGVPWYRVRMNEIGKLKRTLKSRRISEDDLYLAARYAQAHEIPIPGTWRLFELIGMARVEAAHGPATDALQAAIEEAWANDDQVWAFQLNNVHRNDKDAVSRVLKEYQER